MTKMKSRAPSRVDKKVDDGEDEEILDADRSVGDGSKIVYTGMGLPVRYGLPEREREPWRKVCRLCSGYLCYREDGTHICLG